MFLILFQYDSRKPIIAHNNLKKECSLNFNEQKLPGKKKKYRVLGFLVKII